MIITIGNLIANQRREERKNREAASDEKQIKKSRSLSSFVLVSTTQLKGV